MSASATQMSQCVESGCPGGGKYCLKQARGEISGARTSQHWKLEKMYPVSYRELTGKRGRFQEKDPAPSKKKQEKQHLFFDRWGHACTLVWIVFHCSWLFYLWTHSFVDSTIIFSTVTAVVRPMVGRLLDKIFGSVLNLATGEEAAFLIQSRVWLVIDNGRKWQSMHFNDFVTVFSNVYRDDVYGT